MTSTIAIIVYIHIRTDKYIADISNQIKDNPWPFVNLVKLIQNSGVGDVEVVELLKIANRYLPRIRLEYNRVKEGINLSKAELNSWKAATSNEVRTYQQFVDRNIELNKREYELQQQLSVFKNNVNATNLNPEFNQEDIISPNNELISSLNCDKNENEILHAV